MIEIFGVFVGTAFVIRWVARRRRRHDPRALLLAEATEKEDGRRACHAEGEHVWGPGGGDPFKAFTAGDDPRVLEARADWRGELPSASNGYRIPSDNERVFNNTPYAGAHEFGKSSRPRR